MVNKSSRLALSVLVHSFPPPPISFSSLPPPGCIVKFGGCFDPRDSLKLNPLLGEAARIETPPPSARAGGWEGGGEMDRTDLIPMTRRESDSEPIIVCPRFLIEDGIRYIRLLSTHTHTHAQYALDLFKREHYPQVYAHGTKLCKASTFSVWTCFTMVFFNKRNV